MYIILHTDVRSTSKTPPTRVFVRRSVPPYIPEGEEEEEAAAARAASATATTVVVGATVGSVLDGGRSEVEEPMIDDGSLDDHRPRRCGGACVNSAMVCVNGVGCVYSLICDV